ncbi:hypothetical protein [Thermobrachium celere]|uniref:Uncharacterized protein n=1 Tax=Thermobrachium celere DSM 8682 TaxID=941824 RepID=R7RNJ5_9CLOT|nr:hypothetical protein [Thermobrachium celere]GFR36107.1 hypothetical protein TCEA9_19190 [Thermobrachium celere]CDF57767.1 hypothetical protein TCEL_01681 [Thermobrachium celere DSM 8682]
MFYCTSCKRIVKDGGVCEFCASQQLKELKLDTPVNVVGTKLKGRVLKVSDDKVRLLIRDDSNNRFIKEYSYKELKKIL